MTTPLAKRFPRELKNNLGRYLGMFALFVIAIMMTTGFLSAASSIERIVSTMRDDYNVEDLYVQSDFEMPERVIQAIEDKGATVYDAFYVNLPLDYTGASGEAEQATVRLMPVRDEVNLPAYAQGHAPEADDQIALDRVFCQNHGLGVGDTVSVDGRDMRIAGIVTLPDYTSLFESNSDIIFNAQTFTVSQVTQEAFDELSHGRTSWRYSLVLDDRSMSLTDRTAFEEDLIELLGDEGVVVNGLVDHASNQAITFAADDVAGDQLMWETLMLLLVIIMAFVFVVLTNATIEQESSVIGTLLASGYRKRELVGHYMAMPAAVGVLGCVVGNVIGYAFMTKPMQSLYYNSYSLPPFHAEWSWRVFAITTLAPLALLLIINLVGLVRKLGATPLAFLRHEVGRQSRTRNVKLPARLSFPVRFRVRVFLRNIAHFVTLFFDIAFGSVLLLMALCLLPTIDHYAELSRDQMVATHMYTLKAPLELEGSQEDREAYAALEELLEIEGIDELQRIYDEEGLVAATREVMSGDYGVSVTRLTSLLRQVEGIDSDAHPVSTLTNDPDAIEQAEKYTVTALQLPRAIGGQPEETTVYGVEEASRYWPLDVRDGRVYVGAGLAQKCGVEPGGTYTFTDKYRGKTYDITVSGVWGNEANMGVYMSRASLNAMLGNEPDSRGSEYFNGYASNRELAIDARYLGATMTPTDLTKMTNQMQDSMGSIMRVMIYMVVPLYFVLIYLLTKTVIDRSSRVISYMKVFGYHNREVDGLYVRTVTVCVLASLVLCIPILVLLTNGIVRLMMAGYSGNLQAYLPPSLLALEVGIGAATYAVVAVLHVRHVRHIPLAEALKVQE